MEFLQMHLYRPVAFVRRFLGERRGVSTVEYALIVVAVIAIIGVVAAQMSEAFQDLFTNLAAEMTTGVAEVADAGGGGATPATP